MVKARAGAAGWKAAVSVEETRAEVAKVAMVARAAEAPKVEAEKAKVDRAATEAVHYLEGTVDVMEAERAAVARAVARAVERPATRSW